MRTLLIATLAATLVGCSCILPPQASMDACADPNGFGCFNRMADSQPVEQKPAPSKASSAKAGARSTAAAKKEEPSPAHVRDKPQLAEKKPAPKDANGSARAGETPSGGAQPSPVAGHAPGAPTPSSEMRWLPCTPESIAQAQFSAAAYYFGRELVDRQVMAEERGAWVRDLLGVSGERLRIGRGERECDLDGRTRRQRASLSR